MKATRRKPDVSCLHGTVRRVFGGPFDIDAADPDEWKCTDCGALFVSVANAPACPGQLQLEEVA